MNLHETESTAPNKNGNAAIYRWAISVLVTIVMFGLGFYAGNYSIAAEFADYKSKVMVNTSRIDSMEPALVNMNNKLDDILKMLAQR